METKRWKNQRENESAVEMKNVWWAHQLTGSGQVKNELAWRYANKNFLNWKAKKKIKAKQKSQQATQELCDNF